MSRVVTRADRSRDLLALLVLVAGAALYTYAWYGMHNLATKQLVEWVLADKLPVRVQLQMHKYVWAPQTQGV